MVSKILLKKFDILGILHILQDVVSQDDKTKDNICNITKSVYHKVFQ